jgi:alkyl sulfatase BDS1-like metallo-beta-lactamase superfamily hydrolase
MWDQTVRGMNKGWTMDEIASRITLPALYDEDHLTSERYGVAEHHLRQIYTGLRGWFDGEESRLFPLEPGERFARLIAGFGGRDAVAAQAAEAFATDQIRWGVELATWLARSEGASRADRDLLARGLRLVAERTPAANIRNWAITRARHLDGQTPMDRFLTHGFGARSIAHASSVDLVHTLRVLVDPERAEGVDAHLRITVDGESAGLWVRNCVAVPTDGRDATAEASMSRGTFASILGGKTRWSEAEISVTGDPSVVDMVRGCFDHPSLPV